MNNFRWFHVPSLSSIAAVSSATRVPKSCVVYVSLKWYYMCRHQYEKLISKSSNQRLLWNILATNEKHFKDRKSPLISPSIFACIHFKPCFTWSRGYLQIFTFWKIILEKLNIFSLDLRESNIFEGRGSEECLRSLLNCFLGKWNFWHVNSLKCILNASRVCVNQHGGM